MELCKFGIHEELLKIAIANLDNLNETLNIVKNKFKWDLFEVIYNINFIYNLKLLSFNF